MRRTPLPPRHLDLPPTRHCPDDRDCRPPVLHFGVDSGNRLAMFGGIRSSTWAIQFSASASSRRPLRRDLPEPQAGGGTGPLRETLLHVRGERNQGAATCSPTGRRPRPCSPAPLLCDFRQHFGGGVSETRPRRHRGRQGPRSGEVPQGCRPHLRVQGSALVFFDLRRNCSPGSWRTCGRRRRRRRSAVRGSGGPPRKPGPRNWHVRARCRASS